MYEVTEQWLEKINHKFSQEGITYKQRPWLAWMEWGRHTGLSVSMDDDNVKKIFDWFEENTSVGSQFIRPLFVGAFYYDSHFWPVFIEVVLGRERFDAFEALKTIPDKTKTRLMVDNKVVSSYAALWADCLDYALGVDRCAGRGSANNFGEELIRSGDQQLRATITLLHEEQPNSKAMESARMTTEMFLKAFLVIKAGWAEKDVKDKIGHNLIKAVDRCLEIAPQLELHAIRSELGCYPDINERYKGVEKHPGELWQGYSLAQFTSTAIIRSLTGRDVRKTMVLRYQRPS